MLRPLALLLLTLAAFHRCGAQDLDSLRGVWTDTTLPDSARFLACYDLVWDGYLFSDPDSALILAGAMQSAARAKGSAKYDALAYDLQAAAWYVKGDLRKALSIYNTSLPIHRREGYQERVADVITNIASLYSLLGEHDTALTLYAQGMADHERLKDSIGIANDLNAIGRIHMLRGDHPRAVDHYRRSLRIQERQNNLRGISTGRANLGALYINQGDWPTALREYRAALGIAERLDDKHMMGKDLEEIGTCLEELGDTAAAMREFRTSETIRLGIDDRHGLVNVRNRIAGLLFKQGRHQAALARYTESAALAHPEGLAWGLGNALVGMAKVHLSAGDATRALALAARADSAAHEAGEMNLSRDAHEVRYEAFRALGRWEEALGAYRSAVLLNDSIMREENQRAVLRNEYRSAYERTAERDSLRHIAGTIRLQAQHREQRFWLVGLLLLAGVLGGAALLRMRYMARAKRQLEAKQNELVEVERQRENETVRTRIARDIHDDIGGRLTKVAMLSNEAKRKAQDHADDLRATLDRITAHSREVSAALSDIVWSVDPAQDSSAELVHHAGHVAHRLLDDAGMRHKLRFEHTEPGHPVSPSAKHHVVMVMKEAINNALKYAEAERITVRLTAGAGRFELLVQDDGKGFDPLAEARAGNGMRNMGERAKALGASFSLTAAPGQGCTIAMAGPLV